MNISIIKIVLASFVLAVITSATASAQPPVTVVAPQVHSPQQIYVPQETVVQPQTYIPPQTYVQPQTYIPPQLKYYFGMTVSPLHSYPNAGQTTRIQSVVPGSPAALAGLEAGDEIISVNGRRFPNTAMCAASVGQHIDRFVGQTGQSGAGFPVNGTVEGVSPNGVAHMVVINVRNGQHVAVTVRPARR